MTLSKNRYLSVLICSTLYLSSLSANEDENMVKSIMKLRADVEKIYTQISDNKDMHKSELKSLAMQKADLETQINRKETALKQVELKLQESRKKMDELSQKNEDITPLLFTAIDNLEKAIQAGIPFKVVERITELEKIKTALQAKNITPQRALAQIWSNYEDAIRLTKENGLFKQSLTINNEEKLCQIAKIGSVMMFFKTPDESVGYIKKTENGYTTEVTVNEKEVAQINTLFDAFQKQIRTGYFTLPNALVLMENK